MSLLDDNEIKRMEDNSINSLRKQVDDATIIINWLKHPYLQDMTTSQLIEFFENERQSSQKLLDEKLGSKENNQDHDL